MKKLIIAALVVFCFSSGAIADNLYKVTLHSHKQAETLEAMDVEVLMWVRGGYLVLAGDGQSEAFDIVGLDTELLASGLRRDQLAMDGRFDRKNAEKFEILYEDGRVRLLLAGADRLALAGEKVEVFPLPQSYVKVAYNPPSAIKTPALEPALSDDLIDLINQVQQTNLESYVYRLQAFTHRLTGTDSNYAARDWIESKFNEFGYDSVSIDPFIGSQLWNYIPCQSYNVIAYKPGTVYPEQQIIIGGHFDAVPDCPGADDNASGTAAVIEIARILKDVETKMSFVFITFDSEESWLWGSIHYAEGAVARNEDIVLMINPDMIAHWDNDARADLYTGPETAYASLWSQLASNYVGIVGDLSGATASDHWPFQQAGYDVIFVQEKVFSTEYHQPSDSTTYLNFEYMTRMVKATLATLYTVDQHPPPIRITSLQEPGDGHSQIVNWSDFSAMPIDFLRLWYYPTASPGLVNNVDLPITETSYTVDGLTEGVEYAFVIQAYDSEGQTSFAYDPVYAIPSSIPVAPFGMLAMPLREAINVTWETRNVELDFDHCAVIRDGETVGETLDTVYVDNDPTLGTEMHYYYVTAVDTDGNHSDTVGIDPVWMKAAALAPDRVLAVNRSCVYTIDFVDETETGAFLREALEGYDFDYYSDTVATTKPWVDIQFDLVDMIDYGLMVVGAEAGKWDDIGVDPQWNGILDTLAYYMSIGGKVVIFGRWGDIVECDTVDYMSNSVTYDDSYHNYFHIDYRVQTTTEWPFLSMVITSDLVAAKSKDSQYPDLIWDSLATLAHANANVATITEVAGIPCASFVSLTSREPELLYTYDCRGKCPQAGRRVVGWRYLGPDYSYVYFDIPLSMFEREPAIAALRQAVDDVLAGPDQIAKEGSGGNVPNSFGLSQNYPNPFNPATEICYTLPSATKVNLSIFNILGQKVITLVNEDQVAGSHTIQWQGTDDGGKSVATGIYLYRLTAGEFTESKKMLLLK